MMTMAGPATDDEGFPPPEPGDLPVTGPASRSWEYSALGALLAVTAVLYLWQLDRSGWANSFYSAAAQAGSKSWKAFFFGSSDAGNSITVDKPPASLWLPGLSVRVFGLSSWSVLVPEALVGVATVGAVYAGVRRWSSARAALFAGAAMALTPVAALMFRFNNPDALLVLLITLAAYCTLRGIEDGRRRWAVLTGVALGFGFLTKQLQVMLAVPPLAAAYLVCAAPRLRKRIVDVLIAGAAMVVAAGWWVAAVTLWPAGSRPYIGGSQHNSILELTFGYNGLGRLNGFETGSVGGGRRPNGAGVWGRTGITRLFDGVSGGQIAWLIPAALLSIGVVLWATRHRPRTDMTRAAVLVWGGWLAVTALVFSYMQGIYHDYYTVALAPPVAALVAIGAEVLWQHRRHAAARAVLAGTIVLTALWSSALLHRASDWHPWLRTVVVAAAIVAAAVVLAGRTTRLLAVGALAAATAVLGGPTAWALQTASAPHQGAIVTAGPPLDATGFGAGGVFGRPRGPRASPTLQGAPPAARPAQPPAGNVPAGGPTGRGDGRSRARQAGAGAFGGPFPFGGGGLLDSGRVSAAMINALRDGARNYRWAAATIGSNRAAGYQLASGEAVMPIGGFNGSDPSPTLAQFQAYVATGQIHYFIAGGGFGLSLGGSRSSEQIANWVADHYTATEIGGVMVYELTP